MAISITTTSARPSRFRSPRTRLDPAKRVASPAATKDRIRARLSRAWYGNDVQKPTREELEAGHHHAEHEHALEAGLDHPADGHEYDGRQPVEDDLTGRR